MRVSSQLAVIVVLGVAGYGGWYSYQHGYLAALPIAGSYFAKPAGTAAGPGAGPANAPVVDVETVRTGRVVETKESVGARLAARASTETLAFGIAAAPSLSATAMVNCVVSTEPTAALGRSVGSKPRACSAACTSAAEPVTV